MYIIKNALRSINRSKGRNILIGIIVLVIAVSSCVALSIREAAHSAKETYLEDLEIRAQISVDRTKMMEGFSDRESMKEMMTNQEDLSLEEMLGYAEADSVKDFYYSGTTSVNTDGNWEPIDTTGITEDEDSNSEDTSDTSSGIQSIDGQNGMGGQSNMPGKTSGMRGGRMGVEGDCTIVGYSSDDAMTDFLNGTSSITDGEMFGEGTAEYQCVISDELATYNELTVGDEITIVNPNDEEETYELTITGIYHNEQSGQNTAGMMGGFSTSSDTANQIYMSYTALSDIIARSEEGAETTTDENTGRTTSTALKNQVSGTYLFATVEDYEKFEEEAKELGLADDYSISSSDLTSYEQSLEPLENLSEYAMYFFIVILVIGGIILAVLNIFNIRERKYEIGVLAAIGMKKWKIATQYVTELLCVTFVAIIIGAGVGAAGSVPITNMLLEKQIASQTETTAGQMKNFGRGEIPASMPENMPGDMSGDTSESEVGDMMEDSGSDKKRDGFSGFPGIINQMTDYVDEIETATNLTVILQLIGVGILLTLVSSLFAVGFVLRYDPLKIMANRD